MRGGVAIPVSLARSEPATGGTNEEVGGGERSLSLSQAEPATGRGDYQPRSGWEGVGFWFYFGSPTLTSVVSYASLTATSNCIFTPHSPSTHIPEEG